MRVRWLAAARLQALMPIPPGCFEQPGDGGCHLWGGRDVQVFTPALLQAHPAQVSVLTKNVAIQGGEYLP